MKSKQVQISDKVLERLIEEYTKESGVRELDRQLASVMRNIAKKVALKEKYNSAVKDDDLGKILGPENLTRVFTPKKIFRVFRLVWRGLLTVVIFFLLNLL